MSDLETYISHDHGEITPAPNTDEAREFTATERALEHLSDAGYRGLAAHLLGSWDLGVITATETRHRAEAVIRANASVGRLATALATATAELRAAEATARVGQP